MMLAPGMQVFERGWLSANNILFDAGEVATLVDTGYCTHAAQTLALVEHALAGRALACIVNTHLHSDHCGGNAALQARYPAARTLIPPGESAAVAAWDEDALTYQATGQQCPRFTFSGLIRSGDELTLGALRWQVLAAPGHDPHCVVLYCPERRILISADALWENGFGVVFPELEGEQAFAQVGATLQLIEGLPVDLVIPGHGAPFTDCAGALTRAYARLEAHQRDPAKHAWHAAKVLVMYRMMAEQRIAADALQAELARAALFRTVAQRWFGGDVRGMISRACNELMQKGQLRREGEQLALA